MPRKCSICVHSERDAIERALANGESYGAVGKRFGLGRQSVFRHASRHVVRRSSLLLRAVQVVHGLAYRLESRLRRLLRGHAPATAARTDARRAPSRVAGRPKRALLVRAKRDEPMSATPRDGAA